MGKSLHKRTSRYSRNSIPVNTEQPKTRQHLVLPRALQKRGSSIRDIVDEHGKLLTWCIAKEKYGLQKQHFLSWLSAIETVPQNWKQQIRRGKHIMTNYPLQNRVIPVMAVKEVYNKLLNKIRKPPTAQKTMEAVLQRTDINWPKVYIFLNRLQ